MNNFIKFIWVMMFIMLILCIGGIFSLIATVLFPLAVTLAPFAVIAIIWMILTD